MKELKKTKTLKKIRQLADKKVPKKPVKKVTSKPVAKAAKPVPKDMVKTHQAHAEDTGSVEVQVALLTERISALAKHLRKHPKDADSKRGLLMMVGKRRRLLNYLSIKEPLKYQKLIAELKLRK